MGPDEMSLTEQVVASRAIANYRKEICKNQTD